MRSTLAAIRRSRIGLRCLALGTVAIVGIFSSWPLGTLLDPSRAEAGEGEEVWERGPAVLYANGRNDAPKNLKLGDTSATSTSGERSNTVSWKLPPAELRRGDALDLTVATTTGDGAPMIGEIRVSGCGEGSATVTDTTVTSFRSGSRREDFAHGRFVCAFVPGSAPTVQVKAGRYDDYSGEMTVIVTWAYTRRVAAAANVPRRLDAELHVDGKGVGPRDEITHVWSDAPLPVRVDVRDAVGGAAVAGAAVDVYFDGIAAGHATSDGSGGATFAIGLPDDAAPGVSRHALRVAVRHAGDEPFEQRWLVNVERDREPLVVEASVGSEPYAVGSTMTVAGRVLAHRALRPDAGVRARVEVRVVAVAPTAPLASVVTDADGRFHASVVVPSGTGGSVQVVARPDDTRYDVGIVRLEFHLEEETALDVTFATDASVYRTNGTVTVNGTTRDADGPVAASVTIEAVHPDALVFHVASVGSAADGTFREAFSVVRLGPTNGLGVQTTQEGTYGLVVRAKAPRHATSSSDLAYVVVRDDTPESSLVELEVTDLRGRATVRYPAVTPGDSLRLGVVGVGARYTQGAVFTLEAREDVAVLWMPFGKGGSGVELAVRGPTVLRLGTFYKDADGRVRMRVFASEPATIAVRTVGFGAAAPPIDYQLVTASAVLTSTHTAYDVLVDERGSTTVSASEDSVKLIPRDPAQAARLVAPGEIAKVSVPPGTRLVPVDAPPAPATSVRPAGKPRGDDPTAGEPPSTAGPVLDLADGRLVSNAWVTTAATGARATVVDDRMALDVPKTSEGEVAVFSKAALVGDFDLVIDYTLVEWTPAVDASVSLRAYFSSRPSTDAAKALVVTRSADGDGDRVIVEPPGESAPVEKPSVRGSAGAFRVRHAGARWTVSQKDGDAWRETAAFSTAMPTSVFVGFALERQGTIGAKATVRPRWAK